MSLARAARALSVALALGLASSCSREEANAPGGSAASSPAPPAPRFATRREHALPAKPEWVLAADLDGDGFDELVAATIAPGALASWRGGPDGIGGAPALVPIDDYPLRPVLVRDASGATLLAVASRATKRLAFHEPFAREPRASIALASTPRAIAAGDLGADGIDEIALACDGERLVLARPDGRVQELALAGELPRCALVAQDGSGLWIGYQDARAVDFHPYEAGELRAASTRVELAGIPRALREIDFDGDGDLELAVAGGDDAVWAFGLGDARGARAWKESGLAPPVAWKTGAVPIDLEAADLDGDGRAELVPLCASGLTWSVWSDFAREGPRRTDTGYAGQTPLDAALGDFDGDGALDLAVANRDSQCVGTSAGARGSFVHPVRTPVGGFPNALACADLDGDGLPDAVVANSKDDGVSVLANVGGAFAPARTFRVGSSPRAPLVADLDGDGAPEIALLSIDASGARVLVYRRDGEAGYALALELAAGKSARDLVALDLDGDGRLELAVAADESDRLLWFERDAGGLAFRAARELALASGPCALAAIELDGDPDPELAVALGGPGVDTGVALFDARKSASGIELVLLQRIAFDGAPCDVVACDFDGDGRDDLALVGNERAGSDQGALRAFVRRRSGALAFDALGPLPTSLVPRHLAAGDLDGDGRADLAAACQLGHVVDAWLARAGADGSTRLERQDGIGGGVGCFDLALADLDGDGALEIVVVEAHGDSVSVVGRR